MGSPRAAIRRRVLWWVVIPALAMVGAGRLFVWHIAVNRSASLPGLVYFVEPDTVPRCGTDTIVFRVPDDAPHFAGERLLKRAAGCPGDVVSHRGREVFLNGRSMGRAKTHSQAGEPLALGPEGPVPPGHYYAAAPHPDSFDSRYGELGWVPQSWVIGRATRLF